MKTKTAVSLSIGSLIIGALLFWFVANVLVWHRAFVLVEQYNAKVQAQQQTQSSTQVTPNKE